MNGNTYGYANGTYYEEKKPEKPDEKPKYEVVKPPTGATVKSLPKDAKKETVGGDDYYVYDDTWYRGFHSGSEVVYMVVDDPKKKA